MTTPGGDLRVTVERVARQAKAMREASAEATRRAVEQATAESNQDGGSTDASGRPRA